MLDAAWQEGLHYLALYKKRTGHCRVPQLHKEGGYRLGQWVGVQRTNKAALSEERRQELSELGFVWDVPGTVWEKAFEYLQVFMKSHKHCRVPAEYKTADGYPLGRWVVTQRRSDALSTEQKARLDALGFNWDPHTNRWEEGFKHLQVFVQEHKHCLVTIGYRSPDGYKLGKWVGKQRQLRDKLLVERKGRLDTLGFDWDPLATGWEEGFGRLKSFFEEHKHCRVPTDYIAPNGFPLGAWIRGQRQSRDKLSAERKGRLDELGFVWDPYEADWEEGVRYLKMYKEREGHCRVPISHEENGFRLGQWVSVQRHNKRRGDTALRRQRLDELGFVWDPHEADWKEGFKRLQAYVKEYKHCRVPRQYKSPDGYNLGQWVSNQRQRSSIVSPERKAQLAALGFDWKVVE